MTRRLARERGADLDVVCKALERVIAAVEASNVNTVAGKIGVHPDTIRNWTSADSPTRPTPFVARAVLAALKRSKS